MKTPWSAYMYARYILNKRWPEAESIISTKASIAYSYAKEILNGPFPEAEDGIAYSEPRVIFYYAKCCIKGKFEKGEKLLSQSLWHSCRYAKEVLNDRFLIAENAIMSSEYKERYINFVKSIKKFHEIEHLI